MRFLCFLFLVAFIAAVVAVGYYNQEPATFRVAQWSFTTSLAAVVGAAYVLGMLSGWSVWRMFRRSAGTVVDTLENRYVARG
jgi:hypothetical protein